MLTNFEESFYEDMRDPEWAAAYIRTGLEESEEEFLRAVHETVLAHGGMESFSGKIDGGQSDDSWEDWNEHFHPLLRDPSNAAQSIVAAFEDSPEEFYRAVRDVVVAHGGMNVLTECLVRKAQEERDRRAARELVGV